MLYKPDLIEAAVQQSHDAVVITTADLEDPGPKIVFVNEAFTKLTGYTPEEVIGKSPRILQGPKTSRSVLDILREHLSSGQPFLGETANYRKDGTEFFTEWHIAPVRDSEGTVTHFISIQRDISDRKNAEERLRESEEWYSDLFENNRSIMLLIDPDTMRFVDANPSACSFFGYSRDELKEMRCPDLSVLPEETIRGNLERARLRQQEHFFLKHRLKSGEMRDVEVYMSPLRVQGRQVLYSTVRDITEGVRARELLRETEGRYQTILDEAPISIMIMDRNFVIQYVNNYHIQTFGRNKVGRDYFIGKKLTDLPSVVKYGDLSQLESLMKGEKIGVKKAFVPEFSGGHSGYINVRGVPVLKDGDVIGSILLIEDVTELKRMEDALSRQDEASEIRLVGKTPVFLNFVEQLTRASQFTGPVLLSGETGTGKEIAAYFIHAHSSLKNRPFIVMDCTVLTESLFESEIFGYERGAFTGSVGSQRGLIEMADGGILFLDEISEMPIGMQAKLLRVIEKGEFRRVGGKKTLHVNIRLICATNRDLYEHVEKGLFRKDLYYRIAVFSIHVPPLRERINDVHVLAEEFLRQISEVNKIRYRLTPEALRYLRDYDYPGNVRELRNILHLAVSFTSDNGVITVENIRKYFDSRGKNSVNGERLTKDWQNDDGPENGTKPIWDMERRHIAELLVQCQGKRRDVAKLMGVSERTLYRKMKRYGLQ